ncbi:MAG: endonuclease MutS2 [Solobacterium sp.]|nr:endonuclease MutS2 [Solobacterium sp.]
MSLFSAFELDRITQEISEECLTDCGRELSLETRPCFDRLLMKRERDRMAEALAACYAFGRAPFDGISDQRRMLEMAKRSQILTANDLLNEIRLIRGFRTLAAYEKTIRELDHEELHDLFSSLIIHERTERELTKRISEYGEVRDDASEKLKSVRRSLIETEGQIAEAAAKFMRDHAESMMDSIVTTRNGRTVLLIKASDKNTYGGIVYGDSKSHLASYVEPASLMRLNNRKQQLKSEEEDEVARILAECSAFVEEIAEEESSNLDTASMLDAIFARAAWGVKNDACAAVLSDRHEIDIRNARHPLIPDQEAVRNSYHLADPQRTLLITGPNTGGKTVSLKIIGLFTLMTACGMPVIAESCVLPYFDRVFADIGDDQSVASSLSSFSAHMEKQAEMLAKATEHSLILLDEIGSGTDPREGESLAISVLNELRKKHATIIATTHYSRLKAYGKRHDDILVATVEFDMESLRPTYRYLEGMTGESNALLVAKRCGLPDAVVNYAKFLKDQSRSDEETLMEKLEAQLMEARVKNQKMDETLAGMKEYQKHLKEENDRLAEKKEDILNEARREAAEIVDEANLEAERILKDMRASSEKAKYHELLEKKRQLNKIVEPSATVTEERQEGFREGDVVELVTLGGIGKVLKVRKKDLLISVNGRKMKVPPSQVRLSLKILPEVKEAPMRMTSVEIPNSVSMECNLIGMRADEAREELLDYLDQAKLAGLAQVRIIHGDGTGALRKMAHEVLSKDRSVKEFHLGMPSEGGTGATVVVLNR